MKPNTAEAIRMLLNADETVSPEVYEAVMRHFDGILKVRNARPPKRYGINRKTQRCLKAGAAAEYMGISRRHLSDLSSHGTIPYMRLGARLFVYDITDLDHFLDRRKIGAR
jgi:predicted DNA-binding transcriptional regulator AlpA